jgi:DNA-binding transcriptional ArsR family regulator
MESTLRTKKADQKKLKLETDEIRKARFSLRALDHKLRQKMLELIDKQGEIRVTEIYKTLRMEQSEASQHLAILRRGGFVQTKREGKNIYYSVNYQRIRDVEELAKSINSF